MLLRFAVTLLAYLLCIFHFQQSMVTVGQLFGLSGFWALFIPSALIGLSVWQLAGPEWGIQDAAAIMTIGLISLLALTSDPTATAKQIAQGMLGFGIAGIMAGLAMKNGRDDGRDD